MNFAAWNGLDWMLAVVVCLSTARAAWRGLVRALFSLLGIAAGFELASLNYLAVGQWLIDHQVLSSLAAARAAAYLGIIVALVAIFAAIGHLAKRTTHAVGLGLVDRTLGGIFGLARGILIGLALLLAVSAFSAQSSLVTGSQLRLYFLSAAHAVSFAIPRTLH